MYTTSTGITPGTPANNGFISSISRLAELMEVLSAAESELEQHVVLLKPEENLIPGGTEKDIQAVLETLQEGLAKHVSQLLSLYLPDPSQSGQANADPNPKDPSFEDLVFAIKLVESYLQKTQSLRHNLDVLKGLDLNRDTAKLSLDVTTKLPSKCQPKQSRSKVNQQANLYDAVVCVYQELQTTLSDILKEQHMTKTDIDVESLLRESQSLAHNSSPTRVQVINHLQNARSLLKQLNEQGISMTGQDITNLRTIVGSWEQILTKLKAQKDANPPARDAIADVILIHELLEENHDYLGNIFRTSDLMNPALL